MKLFKRVGNEWRLIVEGVLPWGEYPMVGQSFNIVYNDEAGTKYSTSSVESVRHKADGAVEFTTYDSEYRLG